MIIKLERYNKIGGLLIENRATGSQGHICNQDDGGRVSVTRAAVFYGGGRDRDVNRAQGCIQLASELGMRTGMHRRTMETAR